MRKSIRVHSIDNAGSGSLFVTVPSFHRMEKVHFDRPTFCNYCHEFLWGLGRQGYACQICRYVLHKRCYKTMQDVPPTCQPAACQEIFQSTLPSPVFKAGKEAKGQEQSAVVSVYEGKTEKPSSKSIDGGMLIRAHHWVPGNLRLNLSCFVCEGAFANASFQDAKCSCCDLCIHYACIPQLRERCVSRYARVRWLGMASQQGTPVIAFLNMKSGGMGPNAEALERELIQCLGPNQVFILGKSNPLDVLRKFSAVPRLRVLALGGDGTAAWVLSSIDTLIAQGVLFPDDEPPPVAIYPMGTGNDLARTLGWCDTSGNTKDLVMAVASAAVVRVDRWKVVLVEERKPTEPFEMIMNNYFSLGVDAQISMDFHRLREDNPSLTRSVGQVGAKMLYFGMGVKQLFSESPPSLRSVLSLRIDGNEVNIPEDLATFIVVNLPSYAGGLVLWNPKPAEIDQHGYKAQSVDDFMLEVVGHTGALHMASLQIHLADAISVAQGNVVQISIHDLPANYELSLQVDGEPKSFSNCEVTIFPAGKGCMLRRQEKVDPSLSLDEIFPTIEDVSSVFMDTDLG